MQPTTIATDIEHTARRRRRRPARRFAAEDGAALVEFTLLLPVFLLLLFGMTTFGRAMNYSVDETHLANVAARFAAVNNNPGATSGETLQQWTRAQADSNELRNGGSENVPNAPQVCVTFPNGTANVGDPVQVTMSTDYQWLPAIINWGKTLPTSSTVKGSAIMRIEVPPTNYSAGCQ
jgi:Flp pilus assembly protein TadG